MPAGDDIDSGHGVAVIGVRLLDDAYLGWVAAESEAERTLREWLEPPGPRDATAYPAYRAALDREEAAARDLQRLSALASPCVELLAQGERAA